MSTPLIPDKILQDLSTMWTSLAKPQNGAPAADVLRACSLTLVVAAPEEVSPAALGETLAAIMHRHPARAIVIRAGGSEPPSAAVTAQCWMPFGQRRQICSEQIEITAPAEELEEVGSVIGAIAAPDLPVIVWCRCQQVFDAFAFRGLASRATRVIVDSAPWVEAQAVIRKLAEFSRTIHIGDLSWARLTPWRETLFQVFDNPRHAARISEISRVEIVYGGTAVPSGVCYMAAWLIDCLRRAGARPQLVVHPNAAEGRQLQSVEVSGPDFRVRLERLRETLLTTVGDISQSISLPPLADDALMNEDLNITGADPVFERTLRLATTLSL